jgi:alpha-galactosidase
MRLKNILIQALLPLLVFTPFIRAQTPTTPPHDLASFIRTPPAPKTPRINGPTVFGARPGHPFLYHLPVTGDRPMTYSAQGLPDGLILDKSTGNITGTVASAGTYKVTFTASNALGKESKMISLIIGPTICLTPPMGWNSWNCFAAHIDDAKIRSAADAMVKTGLIDHGWTYINMDEGWQGKERDANGNIRGDARFPDIKGMVDYIHGLGLKAGLYSSPGPVTCGGALGFPGSYQHEEQDVRTYADWGIDYLKYDWCSYDRIAVLKRAEKFEAELPGSAAEIKQLAQENYNILVQYFSTPQGNDPALQAQRVALQAQERETRAKLEALYKQLEGRKVSAIYDEEAKAPYYLMGSLLNKANRDIVYSLCQYGMASVQSWGADAGGNTWRVTGDIHANWKSVESHGFELKPGLEKWANPGHWNDPDMLEIGNGNLTPDENYTHMTLWCMLASPLLIGCDMPKMSPFVVSLFSNDEVLAVNQDSLGRQGTRLKQMGTTEVWTKPLADGSLAVAFFNRGQAPADVAVSWTDLGLQGKQPVRDLWRQKDLGAIDAQYSVNVAAHGAELFKIGGH